MRACTGAGSSAQLRGAARPATETWSHEDHRATWKKTSRAPFVYLIVFKVYENRLFNWKLKVVSSEIKCKSGNLVSWKEPRIGLSSNLISRTIYSMWPWANKMGTVNYSYGISRLWWGLKWSNVHRTSGAVTGTVTADSCRYYSMRVLRTQTGKSTIRACT